MANQTLTAIKGLLVGHWTDPIGQTGCTAILAPEGAVASAAFFGPSPGTREAALLEPEKQVQQIQGLLLTGGSAFGLAAADGVMRFLEEQGLGQPTLTGPVPIVPAAVIYDLGIGDPKARPGPAQGYLAAQAATDAPVLVGRVGAGTGATAGKYLGPEKAVRTGLGSSLVVAGSVKVGALAVVNPVGDVVAPDGQVLAGHGEVAALIGMFEAFGNTVLVAIGVEAPLQKAEAKQIAISVQGAIGRVIRPSHTPWDGDASFVLSTGLGPTAPLGLLSILAQEATVAAIIQVAQGE